MATGTEAAERQALTTDYVPQSENGVRIFENVTAHGNAVIEWSSANPGMLESSKWIRCDLDNTVWPERVRDLEFTDCSLRNVVWHFIEASNVSVKGTKKISMHYDTPNNKIVVSNLDNVTARIDGMRVSGRVSGLSFLRVAGSDVTFGDAPAGFFEQTELPLKFGGNPVRMDSSSVQFSYLDNFTVYIDGEDNSIHKNGLPKFSFGGTSRCTDLSRNVAPEMSSAGDHSRCNAQGNTMPGSRFTGKYSWLSIEESTMKTAATSNSALTGVFDHLRAFEVSPTTYNRDHAETPEAEIGIPGGVKGAGDKRNSWRKMQRLIASQQAPVGETPEPAISTNTLGLKTKTTTMGGLE